MDSADMLNVGWREGLVATVVVLVAYLLYAMFRLRRIRHGTEAGVREVAAAAPKAAVDAYAAIQEPEIRHEPEPLAPSGAAFPWNEPPEELPARERSALVERDVENCQRELRALRAEIASLRETRTVAASRAEAQPAVSPAYQEAMRIAAQGNDSATVARMCGISRAEADLVAALVKNRHDR